MKDRWPGYVDKEVLRCQGETNKNIANITIKDPEYTPGSYRQTKADDQTTKTTRLKPKRALNSSCSQVCWSTRKGHLDVLTPDEDLAGSPSALYLEVMHFTYSESLRRIYGWAIIQRGGNIWMVIDQSANRKRLTGRGSRLETTLTRRKFGRPK